MGQWVCAACGEDSVGDGDVDNDSDDRSSVTRTLRIAYTRTYQHFPILTFQTIPFPMHRVGKERLETNKLVLVL